MSEFSTALSRAMDQAKKNSADIADELGAIGMHVSAPTLRAWRSGRAVPRRRSSLAVIAALERTLGLSDGALSHTLRTDASTSDGERMCQELRAAIGALRLQWGMHEVDSVEPVTMRSRLVLSDAAKPVLIQGVIVSARDEPLERLPIVIDVSAFLDPDADPEDERVRLARAVETAGSRVGRSAMIDRWRLAVEAVLDEPLVPGATALLEHRLTKLPQSGHTSLSSPEQGRWFAACCSSPVDTLLAQVLLPVTPMPRDVRVWSHAAEGPEIEARHGLRRGSDTTLQSIALDAPAAAAVIEWRTRRFEGGVLPLPPDSAFDGGAV